jgi:dihydroneopterin aldolase
MSTHTKDSVFFQGMTFIGFHGCFPFEKEIGQRFVVDVRLWTNLRPSGETDDLNQTVNNGEVYVEVKRIVEGPPRDLIEALAHDVAESLLAKFPTVEATNVRITKPQAPIPGGCIVDALGVDITRERQ